ncbi:MAG TPA: helix-turn-helix transcriptional regulator [Candidatus Baltobacteraceae bacterium]|jgi:AraC-like DNA-binding protein|nr:helix-turn-helix transcriptional regulator [Candidatus Baltobacteraceae bacterium]
MIRARSRQAGVPPTLGYAAAVEKNVGEVHAQLDDDCGESDSRCLQPIKVTRCTALFLAAPSSSARALQGNVSWSHSISVKLRDCQTSLIAALRGAAVDPDEEPIFSRAWIPAEGLLRLLHVAANCTSDERFDSLIFEAFELASRLSSDATRRGSPLRMQRLKRFIEQESRSALTLERMAQVTNLSTFACLRQFKEATGMTPYAYLLHCRIQTARGLLRRERVSVAAVAHATGFSDQSYFARIFKKSTGMTPMQYRRTATSAFVQY